MVVAPFSFPVCVCVCDGMRGKYVDGGCDWLACGCVIIISSHAYVPSSSHAFIGGLRDTLNSRHSPRSVLSRHIFYLVHLACVKGSQQLKYTQQWLWLSSTTLHPPHNTTHSLKTLFETTYFLLLCNTFIEKKLFYFLQNSLMTKQDI